MPDITSLTNLPLRVVFVGHFLLLSICMMGSWLPQGYIFYNVVYLLCLFWCIVRTEETFATLQMAYIINTCAIILDILVMSFCLPHFTARRASDDLALTSCILHLIVRPFTTIYLIKLVRETTGRDPEFMSNLFPPSRSTYEDMDRTPGSSAPEPAQYDFSKAEQI